MRVIFFLLFLERRARWAAGRVADDDFATEKWDDGYMGKERRRRWEGGGGRQVAELGIQKRRTKYSTY